jgi:hypothetical protein
MNARTSILTTAAVLALAVPAVAGAKADTTFRVAKKVTVAHDLGQSLAVHKSHASKSGKASKHAAGESSKQSVGPVIYIHVPGPSTPPSAVVDPNECQDSGNNCTDQQACEFWGMNCDSISATAVQTPAQPAAPAAPPDTTPSSPPTSTDDFNASNCWDYADYQATLDPAYC